MRYEVELKFRVDDCERLTSQFLELGAIVGEPLLQVDRYFNSRVNDFRTTGEALRIRTGGAVPELTYKGPVLDTATKLRREIEVPLAPGTSGIDALTQLLGCLGFEPWREVRKRRMPWSLDWNGSHYDLAIDDVEPLGTFLEIERIAEDDDRDAARTAVLGLAARLNLRDPEPRAYLQLLIEQDAR